MTGCSGDARQADGLTVGLAGYREESSPTDLASTMRKPGLAD
jgi:hypothetical protein